MADPMMSRAQARWAGERRERRAAKRAERVAAGKPANVLAPVAGQVVGLGGLMAGVYLAAGLAVALVVGGVLLVALSTLREAGWI